MQNSGCVWKVSVLEEKTIFKIIRLQRRLKASFQDKLVFNVKTVNNKQEESAFKQIFRKEYINGTKLFYWFVWKFICFKEYSWKRTVRNIELAKITWCCNPAVPFILC